jgi:alpha-D-ribose 1-methylphosphonate 5-triphosphate synthase subunit PhnH
VLAGLADPVLDSQRVFRAVLDAMAHPGSVLDVPGPEATPHPLHLAAVAVCLALVDFDTPLWLDGRAGTDETREFLRFHCGCPLADGPGTARFALIAEPEAMPELSRFDRGTDESPDRSATLVVQIAALDAGRGLRLTGPGIPRETLLEVRGLPNDFWRGLRESHALFPRGVDILLTAGRRLAALPRTTLVEG